MWVLTRSDWPLLVNLSRAATITYQQIAKLDPRMRVVAAAWEQEFILADCANGDEARALVSLIAAAIADGKPLLDLRGLDLATLAAEAAANRVTDR